VITLVLITFVDIFVRVFNLLLVLRALLSFVVRPDNQFYQGVVSITEPVVAPVRRVLPTTAGMDFAPVVTFFLLQGLDILMHMLLRA
jgi:YggT family protein